MRAETSCCHSPVKNYGCNPCSFTCHTGQGVGGGVEQRIYYPKAKTLKVLS